MDRDMDEPPQKKVKRNDTKCGIYSKYFRKDNIKIAKTFETKAEVQDFFLKYGYLEQVKESVCNICYAKLRAKFSQSGKKTVEIQSIPSSSKENDPSIVELTKNVSKSLLDGKDNTNLPVSQECIQTSSSSLSQMNSTKLQLVS